MPLKQGTERIFFYLSNRLCMADKKDAPKAGDGKLYFFMNSSFVSFCIKKMPLKQGTESAPSCHTSTHDDFIKKMPLKQGTESIKLEMTFA